MRKIQLTIIFCCTAIIVLFASCEKNCIAKRPKNVKPIDWENYNSVYDVSWNYFGTEISNDMGKDIKICGWIFQGKTGYYPPVNPENFTLIDKEENIFEMNSSTNGKGIYVRAYSDAPDFIDSLKIKFSMADVTKKCYIIGKLSYFLTPDNNCGWINPEIIITDINNIYFE